VLAGSSKRTERGVNASEPTRESGAACTRPILGEPIYPVENAEELLWRIASFLDRQEMSYARRNLAARIRKALAGGDWREELTAEEVERYA
jgi:hypothetical protein